MTTKHISRYAPQHVSHGGPDGKRHDNEQEHHLPYVHNHLREYSALLKAEVCREALKRVFC